MMRIKGKAAKHDASAFLLALIVLMLTGGLTIAGFALRSDPVDELIADDRVLSVLYVIEQNGKPLSSFVLMYYPKTGRAAVFDIPSDMGMLIRRINRVDSIDSVYDSGRISHYKSLIEGLLGVDIAFSVTYTIENIGKAVDLIEGVEIFIPSQVELFDGETPALFPSGLNRLDGDKAMAFIRYTSPDEDNETAVFRRQRFFLSFLRSQAEMNERLNRSAVSKIYHSFMQTSLNQRARTRLLNELAGMDSERISIQAVGGNRREVSGKMLLIPYHDGNLVKDIMRQTLITLTRPADSFLIDRVFTVEVLNGTANTGLAGRTADILRGFGYDIIAIGNAGHTAYDRTVIIDRSGYEEMARDFAEVIRCRNIVFESPAGYSPEGEITMQGLEFRSDFTLILGRDFNGRFVVGN